ncbi:MAG: hypothetical protein IPM20_01750 [Gammaproteobacteria bacterium]|nr:hypothetical protein [Gammaproteobacteria bacterium]
MNVILRNVSLLLLAVLAAGCATSTRLTNAWVDPDFQGAPFQKLIVVGISEVEGNRRIFEDEFSTALRAKGLEAVQSYTLLPETAKPGKSDLEEAVKQVGADGVIIARVVDIKHKSEFSPGYATVVPVAGYPYGVYQYYGGATIVTPPTVYTYEVVQVETSLWRTSDAKLVWSATTATTDPATLSKEIPGYTKVILGALQERGLIPGGISSR